MKKEVIEYYDLSRDKTDCFYKNFKSIFDCDLSESEFIKVLQFMLEFEGNFDDKTADKLMDLVCLKFLNMEVPTNGSSTEDKDKFWAMAKEKSSDVIAYLKN